MKQAVILVPGIMGSELKDGDTVIWPGSPLSLIGPYKHMASLLKPDLVASDVIRKVSVSKQYDDLIHALEGCGITEANGLLTVFPYDWRKDNALAAALLADCIDKLASKLGADAGITLLAHSMGGLVSRCYLESGTYHARPGFAKVASLITMGTPHRGAPMALAAALGQEKRLFLNKEQVAQVANHASFPSVYQLLPPRHEPFAWDRAMQGFSLPQDIYDGEVAAELGLSTGNLAAATKFHDMLDLAMKPPGVRYFFFAGTRQKTTHAIHVTRVAGKRTIVKIDRDDAGDGTVPYWSGAMTGVQNEPVGGEHGDIYKDRGLRTLLGNLLGKAGLMQADGLVLQLALREKVATPASTIHLTLDMPRQTVHIAGELKMQRVVDAAGVETPASPWTLIKAVHYDGPEVDHLAVMLKAPDYTGVYRIAFFEAGAQAGEPVELFVQG
jgi:pimeloyl-ACP methyl ester carboxylesterase